MYQDNAFGDWKPDEFYGLHVRPDFKVGDIDLLVYNQFNVDASGLEAGSKYTLEGMGAKYNNNNQLYPISFTKQGGGSTGISTVKTVRVDDGAIYNLAGQKVDKNYKGVVIMNGKMIQK